MPEYCSCGAQLPPDALFCHKCGKPQREIAPVEPEPAPPTTYAPSPTYVAPERTTSRYAMPVSFRNPAALRIALFVGVAGGLINDVLPLVAWLAAGFFAVFFYRRKTRDRVNVAAGMRIGWLTGLIMFTMWGIAFAAMGMSGTLAAQFEQRAKSLPFYSTDPSYVQIARAMTSGPGLLLPLAFGFVIIICLSMAGGALGAKSLGGQSR
ncbi:MAG TPA: zinc ribbon domain-containing protein [Bryobacteraceae bacterium]|nr:zinc ribbon domain-containing protein [Bryobacteraceae bacterium]